MPLRLGILSAKWLPSSEIIIAALDKIFLALQDTVQMEAVRSKWEEIKKLQDSQSFTLS